MAFEFLRPFKVNSKLRVGRKWDGGYVLENSSLDHVDVVYSYGVGWEVSFERAVFRRTNKIIRLFDPTMFDWSNIPLNIKRGPYWIVKYLAKVIYFRLYLSALPLLGYKIDFHNEGLATQRGNKYDSFANHLSRFGDLGKKVLLKIDIEGGEYEIFRHEGFLKALDNVVQIAIEFHDLQTQLSSLEMLMEGLRGKFSVVHIHANNYGGVFELGGKQVPGTIELTLLNNSMLESKEIDQTAIPIKGLDYPNDINLPDIELSQLFD